VRSVATELPWIHLSHALAILELIEAQDEPRFEPAAVRWLGRLALEAPGLTLDQLHLAIEALHALPDADAKATLEVLAKRSRPQPGALTRPVAKRDAGDGCRSPDIARSRFRTHAIAQVEGFDLGSVAT
jgi:hypothetical protein